MAYISTHRKHHEAVGALPLVPGDWKTYGAWRLMAELARRHPGTMLVVEGEYPAGGTVWFLVERPTQPDEDFRASTNLARLNENGHVDTFHRHDQDRCPIEEGLSETDDPRFWTVESVFSPNVRDMVLDMEACLGLSAPGQTPSTVASTIGWRVIAAALGLALHSQKPLRVSGVLYDAVFPQTDLLAFFSGLAHLQDGVLTESSPTANATIERDASNTMSALFVVQDVHNPQKTAEYSRLPVLAIDIIDGIAYFASSQVDLMAEFTKHNRDIDALAWDLLQRGRAERG